jgi:Tfp pilus assembly protein PilF
MRLTAIACALALSSGIVACGAGKPAPVTSFDSSATKQLSFGVQMARRELWNEALFRFRQAAEKQPNNPRIVNNLAVACEATGQFEEALRYYKDALRLSPTDRTVKGNYTRFVEFYQSLKPPEEETKGGEAESEGSSLSQ